MRANIINEERMLKLGPFNLPRENKSKLTPWKWMIPAKKSYRPHCKVVKWPPQALPSTFLNLNYPLISFLIKNTTSQKGNRAYSIICCHIHMEKRRKKFKRKVRIGIFSIRERLNLFSLLQTLFL